jgi:hypothetical protein
MKSIKTNLVRPIVMGTDYLYLPENLWLSHL